MSTDIFKIAPTFYGITMVPPASWREYGYALLIIAGSDGEVSDPELEWLTVECAQAVGVDEEIIADWEEFDFEECELEEIFHEFNTKSFANFNKLLIYDAIRMSSADGDYAQDERDQVYHAAQILKVPMETVMAIEALVDLEHAANKLRLTIL
ncbi:hypothetical protein [Ekhidna sp.]|uniref:hypothetical protein n=1 Tax=Ekhidna sp. TaxID=2608089 RepID=UPI00351895A8